MAKLFQLKIILSGHTSSSGLVSLKMPKMELRPNPSTWGESYCVGMCVWAGMCASMGDIIMSHDLGLQSPPCAN